MGVEREDSRGLNVGVYDSGTGAKPIADLLKKRFPGMTVLEEKDYKNQPYGNKSEQFIIDAGFSCFSRLMEREVKAIVVACHTSSAIALPWLRKHFSLPVIGMLGPTARLLAKRYAHDEIIWLATPASVQADRLEPLARHLGFSGQFHAVACDRWVDCIEKGDTLEISYLLQNFITDHQNLLSRQRCKVLYGCTHYPLIDQLMSQLLGRNDICIDPAHAVVDDFELTLLQNDLLCPQVRPEVNFLKGVFSPLQTALDTS